jgi:hypothetical protein
VVSALLITIKLAMVVILGLVPQEAQLSTITTNRIIQLTNNQREKAGLPDLTVNAKLTAAAQLKGEDMLAHQYFEHISPTGVTPWFWMAKEGYTYQVAGENLAIDFTQAEDVVSAWMASPSHRANILRTDYTETGVAVVTGEFEGHTSTIVVHEFGKPANAASAATVTSPSPTPMIASPTPAPSVPPAAPATPRTPRIDSGDGGTTVNTTIPLSISSDANTIVHLLLNNQPHDVVPVGASGAANYNMDVRLQHDGTLTVQGYAATVKGAQSDLSAPLTVQKDSSLAAPAVAVGPGILLSPLTDQVKMPTNLLPTFTTNADVSTSNAPAIFSALGTHVMMTVTTIILILLMLAVLIRIRIQHPDLIAHATFVVILAVGLLFT